MGINRNGFQTFVNRQQPPAAAGDFASANPRMSLMAPDAGFVAVAPGCYVGRFAWGSYEAETAHNYFALESRLGFVHREQQTLLTDFLQSDSLLVPEGYPVTLMTRGDFWANFAAGGTAGQKVYADPVTGLATADVTGQAVVVAITAALATTGVLTVSAVDAADLAVGQLVIADDMPAGAYIAAQLSGSAGDTGTYRLEVGGVTLTGTVLASRSMTSYGPIETQFTLETDVVADVNITAALAATGVLTVTVTDGVLSPGQFLTGTGLGDNVQIISQIGAYTGGTGTYRVSQIGVTLTSRAFVASAGKLGKISTW